MSRPSLQHEQLLETKTPLLVENKSWSRKAFDQRRWRPAALSRGTLLLSIAFTACMLVGSVVLQLINDREGYLTQLTYDGRRSQLQSFYIHYLPILLIVTYSLMMDSIDLDCKRLEPFFQLSRAGWTSAKHSLLLRYDVEFAGTIVYKSLRARSVGISSHVNSTNALQALVDFVYNTCGHYEQRGASVRAERCSGEQSNRHND